MQFIFSAADEFAYIAREAGNPNTKNLRELFRIKEGKLIKELKQVKPENVQ